MPDAFNRCRKALGEGAFEALLVGHTDPRGVRAVRELTSTKTRQRPRSAPAPPAAAGAGGGAATAGRAGRFFRRKATGGGLTDAAASATREGGRGRAGTAVPGGCGRLPARGRVPKPAKDLETPLLAEGGEATRFGGGNCLVGTCEGQPRSQTAPAAAPADRGKEETRSCEGNVPQVAPKDGGGSEGRQ